MFGGCCHWGQYMVDGQSWPQASSFSTFEQILHLFLFFNFESVIL